MRSGGGQAEDNVARGGLRAVDDVLFFHDADAKPGQIVILAMVHAGHFGRFSAHQGAARLHAALDDTRDDPLTDVDIEFAGRKIIEKIYRLRALHDDVVHAHRDEIDAHRIVPPAVDCEPQLGAHPVGPRHQDGFAVTVERHFHQRAEAADATQYLGTHRAPDSRFDPLNQFITGVDVDAGFAIGDGCALSHSIPSCRIGPTRPAGQLWYFTSVN